MIRLSGLRGRLTGLGGAQLPEVVFEDITGSARYQSGVSELADRPELSPEDVGRRARACLREMIATQSRPAIDSWEQLGAYLSRACKIDSARPRLEEVRQFGERHPLVFLPNHRSYLDPLSDLDPAPPGSPAYPAPAGPGAGADPAHPAATPGAAPPGSAPGDQP